MKKRAQRSAIAQAKSYIGTAMSKLGEVHGHVGQFNTQDWKDVDILEHFHAAVGRHLTSIRKEQEALKKTETDVV